MFAHRWATILLGLSTVTNLWQLLLVLPIDPRSWAAGYQLLCSGVYILPPSFLDWYWSRWDIDFSHSLLFRSNETGVYGLLKQ